MHSTLNSPQLWVQLQPLLTAQIRCPVKLGQWMGFLAHPLMALLS
ncbi:MAG: hypothetical protein Q8K05_18800 [Polaromonas sp.]|nr:hypothetical protein [Polaromonas sp.]MDP2258076.1 hypothetical protein [Polaromonas sp.]MDP3707643.1 hypothetical protein [Polaromonas sp.]